MPVELSPEVCRGLVDGPPVFELLADVAGAPEDEGAIGAVIAK